MKPTSEQIKALRKGDVVTVRAVVSCPVPDNDGDVRVDMAYGTDTDTIYIKPSEIMTIEPREIKVGDRVCCGSLTGLLVGVDEGQGFVRWDHSDHSVLRLKSLQVIP